MHSLLRPPRQTHNVNADGDSRPIKPLRQRRPLKIHAGVVAFSALGVWLAGGVAWWQYQCWQPQTVDAADTDQSPTYRIAEDEGPSLR